jgi:S1-C subfamily serine protease
MINGVATVLVDRGMKVEQGRGVPDRVLGSAFFVDASGLAITNYHVISSEVAPDYNGVSRMSVRMGDASSLRTPARVVGWDAAMDLALIQTAITPQYVFSIIDFVKPTVGDTVLAIGSPLGLEKTVTKGIVSTVGRRGLMQLGDVIQIDAAVNHGNSGGPLVDTSGRLVGVVFAGADPSQATGLNFAIPADRLAAALPAMLDGGPAKRPWLGLDIADNSVPDAAGMVNTAQIVYVAPLTPAAEQDVAELTNITKLAGKKVSAAQGSLIPVMQNMLFSRRPGELVDLETSDGKKYVLRMAVRPKMPLAEAAKIDTKERMTAPLFGIILTPAPAGQFTPTYYIKEVIRGSIADQAGLSANDPVQIAGMVTNQKDGYVVLQIRVKKRALGYMESMMALPAALDEPDKL